MEAERTSSTSPLRQMMRSFRRREKMSAVGVGRLLVRWTMVGMGLGLDVGAYRCASRLPTRSVFGFAHIIWWDYMYA